MASGSTSVKVSNWTTLVFRWEQTSQSVANNTSTVSWVLELVAGTYGRISASSQSPWAIEVNGTEYTGKTNIGIENNSTKTLASGSLTIPHNTDGSKRFSYTFQQTFNITFSGEYISTLSGSGTGTLDTIPRASQPSCITWPEHTRNVGYFGDTISIHMNRNSSAFTHTVRYQFGDRSGTIATGVGTGTTWTIPLTLMELLPAITYGSGTIYVDTYNGSTLIGTKYCGFTASVPASIKPSCTIQVLDDTDVLDTYGNLVKGLSKLYVKTNFYAAYGSPVSAYNVTANGVKYTAAEIVTDYLTAAGTTTVTATVTDKRGRTSEQASASFPVIDYAAPVISDLAVHRCDMDGTANAQGEYVEILFSAVVSPLNDLNSATYTVKYKKTSASSWTTLTEDVNGWKPEDLSGNYAVSNQSYIFAADSNSSYDVIVTVVDDHNTTSRSTSASTAFTLMNWNASGNGMGIGRVSEKENTLQIEMDVEFFGKLTGTIFDAILPVGSMVLRYDHIDPSTIYPGTTWERVYGAFPWFTDANGQIGTTGGERTVTLTKAQMPAHDHGGTYTNAGTARTHAWLASGGSAMGYDTVEAGGGQAHNNMPPYIQISAWRRTA